MREVEGYIPVQGDARVWYRIVGGGAEQDRRGIGIEPGSHAANLVCSLRQGCQRADEIRLHRAVLADVVDQFLDHLLMRPDPIRGAVEKAGLTRYPPSVELHTPVERVVLDGQKGGGVRPVLNISPSASSSSSQRGS